MWFLTSNVTNVQKSITVHASYVLFHIVGLYSTPLGQTVWAKWKKVDKSFMCVHVCMYVTASNLIIFWLNGSRIISTNRRVYVDRHRVSIEGHGDTYNLRVRNVQQYDDGEYSCQVPGPQPITQTSRVIVSSKLDSFTHDPAFVHILRASLYFFLSFRSVTALAIMWCRSSLSVVAWLAAFCLLCLSSMYTDSPDISIFVIFSLSFSLCSIGAGRCYNFL